MSTPYHKAIAVMYSLERAYEANRDKNHSERIAAFTHFLEEIAKLPIEIELGLMRIIIITGKWPFPYLQNPQLSLVDLWDAFSNRVRHIGSSAYDGCVKAAQFHIDLYHLQDFTERYGKDAATMFKLSEGNIDPRGEE